ncbi:hypothetical protein Tco_0075261 [Tanacetum coccineum]
MQFLMGLDDIYLPIRSSLLTREPLPDVKIAFSLISTEESHRGSSSGSAGTKVSVFAAKKVPTSPSTQLTPEQIQQLLNLLNSKPAKNVQANMAGTLLCSNSKTFYKVQANMAGPKDL